MTTNMRDPELKFWTTKPNEFWVATSKAEPARVLGCIACNFLDSETVEVARVSVDKAARGQGLGRKLMDHVLTNLRHKSVKRVTLTASNGQQVAIKLYKKMGFRVVEKNAPLTILSKILVLFSGIQVYTLVLDLN